MSEWKEYTGSHAEIDEMRNSPHGFIAKNLDISSGILKVLYNQLFLNDVNRPLISKLFGDTLKRFLEYDNTTHYLICNPHPLADIIIRQAQTGQPVWVRVYEQVWHDEYEVDEIYATTTPDWNIPNAEYSFTSFKE